MSPIENILLVILGVLIFAYIFVNFYGTYPVHNDGSVEVTGKINNSYSPDQLNNVVQVANDNLIPNNAPLGNQELRMEEGDYLPNNDYAPPEIPNKYINSSYNKGIRGNYRGDADLDAFFDQNNNVIRNAYMDKPIVTGFDETNGEYGAFFPQGSKCSASDNQDCDPYDLYNADNYLPQQKIPSWFEVGPDPVAVKDRNLVNISRTMGINTTMGNKTNMSWDIRGGINNPRTLVGPWNQSVIEPGDDYHRLN
mgnify:CR=1 FL=1